MFGCFKPFYYISIFQSFNQNIFFVSFNNYIRNDASGRAEFPFSIKSVYFRKLTVFRCLNAIGMC